MTFSTKVISCSWQQPTGEWLVKLEQTNLDGSKRQFEDRCHMLIQGTGVLNTPQWPNIKGIEKFKGKVIHTAMWPEDYQSEEWKKDRVAVIGSGVSLKLLFTMVKVLTFDFLGLKCSDCSNDATTREKARHFCANR